MNMTRHGELRCDQRGFSRAEVAAVMESGTKIHRTGIVFYVMTKKDVMKRQQDKRRLKDLEGLTVLVSQDSGSVISVYKNKAALSTIRKKGKRGHKWKGAGTVSDQKFNQWPPHPSNFA